MIDQFEKIPTTETSHPQGAAPACCELDRHGYVEEEYFVHGTANVYTCVERQAVVRDAHAPYVNRILVRRPRDAGKASGRVVVEILNATAGMDIDRMWVITHGLFLRNGDTYVGITSKPSSLRAMKKLDARRYAPLHWTNPQPRYLPQMLKERHDFCGAISEDSEAGLFWDMLTETAADIRSGRLPLGLSAVDRVYLTGWSQSVIYMVLYLHYFAYRNGGKSPFDGYFAGGGTRSLAPALNQYDIPACAGEYGTILHTVTEPYVAVQTESENYALGNEIVSQPDSDGPQLLYRRYDVPGATHDNTYTMADYYRGNADVFKMGLVLSYPAKDPYPNNYPYQFPFHRACDMLYRWAEENEAPPRMQRIPVGHNGQNVRDRNGNALQGWRMPAVDLPVCTYYPFPQTMQPSAFALYGSRHPFPGDKLRQMYGSLANYRALVEENAGQAVREGRLLQADYEACVDFSVRQAQAGGLT